MLDDAGQNGTLVDDCALLAMVERGDERAMASLYDRHSKIVYSVALRVCRDVGAAEDVVQEIFIQIWRNPRQFAAVRGSFSVWLSVISRHRSIDRLRSRRQIECVDDLMLVSSYDLASDAELNLMMEKARILIPLLPPDQRSYLEMAFFDGKTHKEIAEETNCPLGTVKTRIRTALSSLRKGLHE